MIHAERVKSLNAMPARRGRYVLYWMQQSQRAECNHALEFAVRQANRLGLPVVAAFGLTEDFPEANVRHYTFMLEGLTETQQVLAKRGIQLVVHRGSPAGTAIRLAADASLVVADRGYLRIQREWRSDAAMESPCPVVQVESDVVVPVETASWKEEYSAATLRPKMRRRLAEFLVPLRQVSVRRDSMGMHFGDVQPSDPGTVLSALNLNRTVPPSRAFRGGASKVRRLLDDFLTNKLVHYADLHSEPSQDGVSHMSPYLHFGQISPLEVALKVSASIAPQEAKDAYLEQLIVRRELSMNFTHYNDHYDMYAALPQWARSTVEAHATDRRLYEYTLAEWERSATHDPYWNAAQKEMVLTGKMHNTMRMYWGKKLIEWTATPHEAFRIALHLNNKYELDGRDPNGFAGVAWCFGKHDRPWAGRPIFGNVRYMNAAGLERKYNMDAYCRRVESLSAPDRSQLSPRRERSRGSL
jgi:deoxyribodipyrimidine photo-lyase